MREINKGSRIELLEELRNLRAMFDNNIEAYRKLEYENIALKEQVAGYKARLRLAEEERDNLIAWRTHDELRKLEG